MLWQSAQLRYPFAGALNPFSDKIEAQTTEWINEYSSVPERVREKYKQACFGKLAAFFWPLASFEQLIPLGRWTLWIFIFDDYYGPCPAEEIRI